MPSSPKKSLSSQDLIVVFKRASMLFGAVAIIIGIIIGILYAIFKTKKEKFCTCRGMQYNNSSADQNQANCYKNKVPSSIWNQSHAGCTCVADPGTLSYNYNVLEEQLPEFSGV